MRSIVMLDEQGGKIFLKTRVCGRMYPKTIRSEQKTLVTNIFV